MDQLRETGRKRDRERDTEATVSLQSDIRRGERRFRRETRKEDREEPLGRTRRDGGRGSPTQPPGVEAARGATRGEGAQQPAAGDGTVGPVLEGAAGDGTVDRVLRGTAGERLSGGSRAAPFLLG